MRSISQKHIRTSKQPEINARLKIKVYIYPRMYPSTRMYPVTTPVFAVPHAAGAGRLLAAAGCGKWPPKHIGNHHDIPASTSIDVEADMCFFFVCFHVFSVVWTASGLLTRSTRSTSAASAPGRSWRPCAPERSSGDPRSRASSAGWSAPAWDLKIMR